MTIAVILLSLLGLALAALSAYLAVSLKKANNENTRLRNVVTLSSKCGVEELEELRRLRHDLRHYLINGGEAPQLHIQPSATGASAFSAIINHYGNEAAAIGVNADIAIDIHNCGDELIPDLCLVISNLLENAVEALRRENGGWLRARSVCTDGYVTLVVGNSSSATLKTRRGEYLSSKAPDRIGVGLATVEEVARHYGGKADFSADGKQFLASVFIPRPARAKTEAQTAAV